MAKILVAYASMAGSTGEIAAKIAETLTAEGSTAEHKATHTVNTLDGYDAVVLAVPMIVGWHRDALDFLQKFAPQLAQMPVAYCITCYELARTGAEHVEGIPVTVDPNFGPPPQSPPKLSFKERRTTPAAYLRGPLKKAPAVKPVSAGIFKGKINYNRLGFFPRLFVRFLIRAEEGDYRNWDAITAWAQDLRGKLAP